MTSSPHGPYIPGYTRATMAGTTSRNTVKWSQSLKTGLSSDCSLQLDCMKSESLVIADQHAAVNTFPGLVHRPSRHGSRQYPKPVSQLSKVRPVTGAKS